MNHVDSVLHVRGEAKFTDDEALTEGMLFADVFTSPLAHGRIVSLDTSQAERIPGVHRVLTADDIPGENQIGNIIQDEQLLAQNEVHYRGQPIAIVVAENSDLARKAVKNIAVEIEELPAIVDPREAFKKGQLIAPSRTFSLGDVDAAWEQCDVVVSGVVESGGQEHIYLETQSAFALPMEDDAVKVVSATQSASAVQRIIAGVLGVLMHKVEVDVLRLGGAFGGKEDQATPWAAMVALTAFLIKKPVKLTLRRQQDIRLTGKRHPYSSDFKIGLNRDGKILAYEVFFYQNAGAAADLSTAILERTLFHITNSYYIPNVKATAVSCRTNLPPNTAFRGFGGPQAMFVIESAIFKAAEAMGVDPAEIQKKNLLNEGDQFPYGMKVKNCHAHKCWDVAEQKYDVEKIRRGVDEFNASHATVKKGFAVMPICFGISFTSTFLNQASALVHVYTDGSVSISTAAVEMGQGVKTKIRQVAAQVFSIDASRIKVESTNTKRIANMSPTAASTGADLNGNATKIACEQILSRLKEFAGKQLNCSDPDDVAIQDEKIYCHKKETVLTWEQIVSMAYMERINLSAHAHYATAGIWFDRTKEKGQPFAYHVFGTGLVEVTVDCLRGTYTIDAVKVVHDFGQSLNPAIDRGQVEGGIVQGLGWMTIEELLYDESGQLLTDSLSTYKVPDIHFAPDDIQVHFLENSINPPGPFNSKAIGEPPFMYGIGVYFALWKAMKAFRSTLKGEYNAPLTPEKVLLHLYQDEIE